MDDVIVVGGGPAGAFAALLLARAGARVRVFERSCFPRNKLCGDTINPGAVQVLARHLDLASLRERCGMLDGMILTGPGGSRVRGRYADGEYGWAVTRRVFDEWLLVHAVAAGAIVEEGVTVRGVVTRESRGSRVVGGVRLQSRDGRDLSHQAGLVFGTDGRRSTLAFGLSLARQPPRPRRWAIGAYFTDVDDMTTAGEMHVRVGHYIGVAPVPGGLANACLVVPRERGAAPMPQPGELLAARLQADPELRRRFARARAVGPAVVLGPMAVDCDVPGAPGLLLAGDAAGFIDPMTGDGIHLALRGAELAAAVAFEVMTGAIPTDQAHRVLCARRNAAFRSKWRFNRVLRALVATPRGVPVAALTGRVAPSLFERAIRYAGDGSRLASAPAAPRALAPPGAPVAPGSPS